MRADALRDDALEAHALGLCEDVGTAARDRLAELQARFGRRWNDPPQLSAPLVKRSAIESIGEAAAIGSIDIGAASLPEKRPLTSFIGLGQSDVAGAMVNVSNERRSCELAIYASNSVLRRAPRRAGDRAPALHFQPSRNLRIWRCTQPGAYIAGVRAGTRCQLTCWRGHRPQDHHQPYLPCGTTVAGRGLVTHTRLNVPTRTPISRQFLIRLDAGRLGLRACGKARGRGQRDDNCRSSGENDLLHGWSPF